MTSQREILNFLKERQPEMLSTLEEFTNTDSPSTSKEHVDRFAELVSKAWKGADARVSIIRQDTFGNHVRAEWGSGEDQVLVLCHMDTVWDAGEAAKRPFKVEGTKAYGPGVYDMKGGIVEALYAVKALAAFRLDPGKRLVILHNSDEEIGSPSSRSIIEEEARKSRAVLVLEPSAQGGALKTWRKGVGMFQIRIKGREAHAGADYEKGVSAILEAAHQTIWLQGLTDLEEGTTVNVGTIQGGTRRNVVAGEAILGVDLRVKTQDKASRILSRIRNIKSFDPRVTITVEGGLNRPPMERNEKNVALFQLAKAIGSEMGIELVESGTGGGSDGNFTSALGIPTLDGLGPVGDDAHSPGEYVIISSLPERAAVVAGLMLRIS